MSDPDEQFIRFTVKELLVDLKSDIKEIKAGFVHKADQAEVTALQVRVVALETDKASNEAVANYKKWQIGILAAIGIDVLVQAYQFARATGVLR